MRCLLRLSLLGLASLAIPALAHADTFTTFNLSGVTLQNGSASGTVTLDTTTGNVSASKVTVVIGSNSYLFNAFDITYNDSVTSAFNLYDAANDFFQFDFHTPTLVGYAGVAGLCTFSNPCEGMYAGGAQIGSADVNFITAGSLTVAPTPEPSSLVLLGTGAVGLLGVARRRFLKA